MRSIEEIFVQSQALKYGHFQLTSGRHSGQYFQCAVVLQYPEFCELLARKIVEKYVHTRVDVVISPAVGGIVIGQEVGRQLGVRTIFAEREDGRMILRRGFSLKPGEHVLICEDVVTTGGSVLEVISLVRENRAVPAGVGFIVDRSGGSVDFGTEQYAVMTMTVETYEPDDCPMCREGLPIEKPGSRKSFQERNSIK